MRDYLQSQFDRYRRKFVLLCPFVKNDSVVVIAKAAMSNAKLNVEICVVV